MTRTKVVILTGSYRIKGYINLVPGGRVTDYILGAKDFIAVTDAEVWAIGGGGLVLSAQFIDVCRDQIQMITTEDKAQRVSAAVASALAVAENAAA